jgi:hypothetical protein
VCWFFVLFHSCDEAVRFGGLKEETTCLVDFIHFGLHEEGYNAYLENWKIDVGIGGYKIELYKCIIFFNSILLSIYCFFLLFLSMYCYFECILYCVLILLGQNSNDITKIAQFLLGRM